MDEEKRKRLEADGWTVGSVQDLLGLTDEQMAKIDAEIEAGVDPGIEVNLEEYDWGAHHEEELANIRIEQEKERKLELEHIKQSVQVEYSVIQIGPDARVTLALRGAFAVVTEVKVWGVVADVPVVYFDETPTSHAFEVVAPVRLEWGAFKLVGIMQYDPADFQV